MVAAVAVSVALGLGDRLADLRATIDDLGPLAPVVFVLVYIVAVVALVPASLLTVTGGALFGVALGSALVVVGATVGACLAFLVARHVARDATASWLAGRPTFDRLDRITGERGGMVVLLVRLAPFIPFSALNYAFGVSRVAFGPYAIATAVGIVPGVVLYLSGADAVVSAIDEGRVSVLSLAAIAIGAAALSVVTVVARRRLRAQQIDEPEPPSG